MAALAMAAECAYEEALGALGFEDKAPEDATYMGLLPEDIQRGAHRLGFATLVSGVQATLGERGVLLVNATGEWEGMTHWLAYERRSGVVWLVNPSNGEAFKLSNLHTYNDGRMRLHITIK